MSNLPYMPFYITDYMTDAGHLPTLAHGAYMLLIMNYWQRQGPIPADDFTLQGITKLSDGEWERLKPHLLRFFHEEGGNLHHKRIDEEIDRAQSKLEQVRNAGKASAERKFNARSTPVQRPLGDSAADVRKGKVEVEGKVNTTLLNSNELSGGSISPPLLDEREIERRLEQATGWRDLRNLSSISSLITDGADLEGRVLPLARTVAGEFRDRGRDPPKTWGYLAEAVRDPKREAAPSEKTVETVFVTEGSPQWNAIVQSGKKESFLRGMLKSAGDGTQGIYWAAERLPKISEGARP